MTTYVSATLLHRPSLAQHSALTSGLADLLKIQMQGRWPRSLLLLDLRLTVETAVSTVVPVRVKQEKAVWAKLCNADPVRRLRTGLKVRPLSVRSTAYYSRVPGSGGSGGCFTGRIPALMRSGAPR